MVSLLEYVTKYIYKENLGEANQIFGLAYLLMAVVFNYYVF